MDRAVHVWLIPADAPTRQIDHILGRGVTGTGEPVRLGVSDHQALLAEV